MILTETAQRPNTVAGQGMGVMSNGFKTWSGGNNGISNNLIAPLAGSGDPTIDVGVPNHKITWEVNLSGGSVHVILYVRYTDSSNYVIMTAAHTLGQITLTRRVAGSNTSMGSVSGQTFPAGTLLSIEANGNDFTCRRNGTTVHTGNTALLPTGNRSGFRVVGGTGRNVSVEFVGSLDIVVANALAASQQATAIKATDGLASSNLALNQELALSRVLSPQATNSLLMLQELALSRVLSPQATNSLSLSQSLDVSRSIALYTANVLTLVQTAARVMDLSVESVLTVLQSVSSVFDIYRAEDRLFLEQWVSVTKTHKHCITLEQFNAILLAHSATVGNQNVKQHVTSESHFIPSGE